jgi:uncharacterized protein
MLFMSGSGLLVEVDSSPIEGRGVFARRRIPAGTRIVEFTGRRITLAEAEARPPNRCRAALLKAGRGLFIDPEREGNAARYINHSCEPNCEAVLEGKRVFIEAIREIDAGAELTFDYALDRAGELPPDWRQRYACRCGARTCRGSMFGPWAEEKSGGGKRKRGRR